MAGAQLLTLVANPGSSSRKYALYESSEDGLISRGSVNIETSDQGLIGTLISGDEPRQTLTLDFSELEESSHHIEQILRDSNVLNSEEKINALGIRVVAPGSYFMHDRTVDSEFVEQLEKAKSVAPIHVSGTLAELSSLQERFTDIPVVAVSDSAFHATKPPYAWNYGLPIHDADRFDIKRFGYHGISVQGAVDALWDAGKLPPKLIVCHLGSGSSVTAVFHGRSIDTTMGYSPLEGVLMATRVGSIDLTAVMVLQEKLGKSSEEMQDYLNHHSGLLGIGQSADIRELIEREADGDHLAHLALTTLVHTYHKAIGQMLVALGGADAIVFTGTVGERSAILRRRIVAHLAFAEFHLDGNANDATLNPEKLTVVSEKATSRPVIVIPANESYEIAKHVTKVLG